EASSTSDLANIVNDAFILPMKIFSPLPHDFQLEQDIPSSAPFVLSVHSVFMKLSLLNPTKAQGPDGLPVWLLKENADLLAEPIAEIINSSFREIAEEFIIQEYVKPAVLKKIKSNQFGSIPKSSTTQALISMIHTWSNWIVDFLKCRKQREFPKEQNLWKYVDDTTVAEMVEKGETTSTRLYFLRQLKRAKVAEKELLTFYKTYELERRTEEHLYLYLLDITSILTAMIYLNKLSIYLSIKAFAKSVRLVLYFHSVFGFSKRMVLKYLTWHTNYGIFHIVKVGLKTIHFFRKKMEEATVTTKKHTFLVSGLLGKYTTNHATAFQRYLPKHPRLIVHNKISPFNFAVYLSLLGPSRFYVRILTFPSVFGCNAFLKLKVPFSRSVYTKTYENDEKTLKTVALYMAETCMIALYSNRHTNRRYSGYIQHYNKILAVAKYNRFYNMANITGFKYSSKETYEAWLSCWNQQASSDAVIISA
ncbi:RNA-directed DNA polymerase from mobile element jockey, partial [Paramuricea clavata]